MNPKRRRVFWWGAGSLLFVVCVGLIWAAYRFSWPATGFVGKTLWDWLQLLIIPVVLALGAVVFQQVNARTERQIAQQRYKQDQAIALEKQKEDLLQSYLDRMSELLLEKQLRLSQPDAEVRNIARVRTISTLIQLDATRVGYVFAFLLEAGLLGGSDPIISLYEANLAGVQWSYAILINANLFGVNFSKANLFGADLRKANLSKVVFEAADLSKANLFKADLSKAYLLGANLSEAHLRGADLSKAHLRFANLNGACFTEANLSGADLIGADLRGADLIGADFGGAKLAEAIFEKEQFTPEQQAQAIWT
jgi:uncharacterized protein YjbI with pentapeptide repeats